MQSWYSAGLVWLIAGLLLMLIAGIAIWQYLLGNRPKITAVTLEAGIVDPESYVNAPTGTAGVDETAVLYLLDVPKTAVTMVQCPLRLTNTGEHGINSVRVQLEYPNVTSSTKVWSFCSRRRRQSSKNPASSAHKGEARGERPHRHRRVSYDLDHCVWGNRHYPRATENSPCPQRRPAARARLSPAALTERLKP